MSAALDNGLSVTALHNRFFYDEPTVYFMHMGGEGSVEKLAAGVRKVQDKVKESRSAAPQPANRFDHKPLPKKSIVTAAPLAEAIGAKATEKDGMVTPPAPKPRTTLSFLRSRLHIPTLRETEARGLPVSHLRCPRQQP